MFFLFFIYLSLSSVYALRMWLQISTAVQRVEREAPTWPDFNFIHIKQLSIDWECSIFSLSIYLCLVGMHWECDCRSAQQCREWKEKLRRGRTPKDLTAPVVSARPCGEERTFLSFNFWGVSLQKYSCHKTRSFTTGAERLKLKILARGVFYFDWTFIVFKCWLWF